MVQFCQFFFVNQNDLYSISMPLTRKFCKKIIFKIRMLLFFVAALAIANKELPQEIKQAELLEENIPTATETEISPETNSTEITPSPTPEEEKEENKKIPIGIAIGAFAIIIITVGVVAFVLKRRQDTGKYDPNVDLGLVENEVI